MTIDRALEQSPELKQLYDGDPSVRRLIDTAKPSRASLATPRRTPPASSSPAIRSSTTRRSSGSRKSDTSS